MKALRLKTHHFHAKLPYQKLKLRQIEWLVQNGLITNNGVLPVTTLFFWKLRFSLRTSYKELICCTNKPNAHISTFCKRFKRVLFDGAVSIINACFSYSAKLLEWFHHLNLLWKYSEFRLVYFCHKKWDIQMLFWSHKFFYSKTSTLFFLKQESLITQLPIISAHYLLEIFHYLLI